jgi:hypothetical protein
MWTEKSYLLARIFGRGLTTTYYYYLLPTTYYLLLAAGT